ncbi:LuxR C-terminal-related transcriptional regulator [Actinoplanes sp. NPDC026619]|uniref:LuxR C-terminal-related transcriptional regulator n=1 Tax=Actinoplanes sp. NPDC026619 TaxID=3155798 RepID=UPI0033D68BC3
MAGSLVETKFYLPRVRRGLVARERLVERLGRGAEARLTLVSAPAGFGKTTLLAEGLAGAKARVAWVSLEESDRQPGSFWSYVLAALDRVVPGIKLLHAARLPIEALLTTVINELSAEPEDVYLVLDDYHLADGPEIQAGMAFLLAHLPPQVHLVVSTRADPALPLAGLRARGELVEIRAADLRFTLGEVTAYVKGLDLAVSDIAVLAGRTEGWIAALQLAALSMRGRADVAGFIAGFAGDDRYIVDYLVGEVLDRQPAEVREFLISTCVLDRLTGPLCDAVTGRAGGRAMLEALDRGNLFVVSLDGNRRWYRYHHLFADMLLARLTDGQDEQDEQPGQVAELHRRAAGWYEQNGEPAPAIRHALAAGDVERAAGLIELAIPALRQDRQEATIRGWLDAIPAEVVRVRPVLAIGFIGALMAGNEFADVERRLGEVAAVLAGDRGSMVVVDESEFPRLPAAIEMYYAAFALMRGDPVAVATHARQAIDHAAAGDHVIRAAASALLGLSLWSGGDLEAAHQAYSASVDGLRRAGHLSDVLGCSITLADIRITQGRLDEALRTYERALLLGPELRGNADMHVGMSRIALERNDLTAAAEHLRRAEELGEHTWLPQNPYRWRVASAALREAQGDLDGAVELLQEAQRVYVGDFSPNVRPVPAMIARVLAAQGRIGEALAWAGEQGLAADDELSYLREFEHITLARVLLASPAPADADRLLTRLLAAAVAGGRTGSAIEILVLQAGRRGDPVVLERALTLAEPHGYVRAFAGVEPALLRRLARQQPTWGYVRRLLDSSAGLPGAGLPGAGSVPLVDPLSERELDVLRLLRSDLDGPAIARELTVSLNTLRTHTKNIYAKLGVNSRRGAVRRAAELALFH